MSYGNCPVYFVQTGSTSQENQVFHVLSIKPIESIKLSFLLLVE